MVRLLRMSPYIKAFSCLWLLACGAADAPAQTLAQLEQARQQMVKDAVEGAGVSNARVLESLQNTLRHEFLDRKYRREAYFDMALPIGNSQTISSPFIVGYMTEALDPQPTDKVLEIGTGSGYQAAVLSPLVADVYTIEIVESLHERADRTLRRLGYDNVHTRLGDGYQGWPQHAPFDKIIVTCSPEKVPRALVDQLREGGLMVIPVGERYQQTLFLFRKKDGRLEQEALRPTLFVPMTGKAEARREKQPDPAHPQAENGDFEHGPAENGFMEGWYYQRQLTWESQSAPQGDHFVSFQNDSPGRSAHLLQGFAIDGTQVGRIDLSAWVRCEQVQVGQASHQVPLVAVSFYDQNRRELGARWLGPFRGNLDWKRYEDSIPVPRTAREGILRIGLFGATGKVSFDDVQIRPHAR